MGNYYFKDRNGCELDGHPSKESRPIMPVLPLLPMVP